jgi:hypothetical protein
MEQNLRQNEFLVDFKRLTEQPYTSYNYSQFIEFKKYDDYLWNFFVVIEGFILKIICRFSKF